MDLSKNIHLEAGTSIHPFISLGTLWLSHSFCRYCPGWSRNRSVFSPKVNLKTSSQFLFQTLPITLRSGRRHWEAVRRHQGSLVLMFHQLKAWPTEQQTLEKHSSSTKPRDVRWTFEISQRMFLISRHFCTYTETTSWLNNFLPPDCWVKLRSPSEKIKACCIVTLNCQMLWTLFLCFKAATINWFFTLCDLADSYF